MKPKPDLKKIAKADDKIATAADEMIKGPLWMIEQILRKHEQAVMEVMAEQQQEIRRLEDERDAIIEDSDKAHQLLREAENEMRYAGWGTYHNDNPARFEVFKLIEVFVK